MTDIHIPAAALEAGARAAMDDAGWHWDTADETRRDIWRKTARAAFVAMVEAWPGMEEVDWYHNDKSIILPLLQEKRDADSK